MSDPVFEEKEIIALGEEDYDTSDKEEVNKARKRSARTRADRLHFVQAAMTTEQGRAWFYDLLIYTKFLSEPFDDDAYRTAFNCGKRNIGARICDDIQTAAPNDYLKMLKENQKRQ